MTTCYFCNRQSSHSLLVSPRPKNTGDVRDRFGDNWFQHFCEHHWTMIENSGLVDLTKPIERSDLFRKFSARAQS